MIARATDRYESDDRTSTAHGRGGLPRRQRGMVLTLWFGAGLPFGNGRNCAEIIPAVADAAQPLRGGK
jgi:hypothetical protein